MRAKDREPGARPQIVTVFLDPPTAAVLDVMEFRSSFFGFLHVFHENLTIPEYSGRQIVGWVGVGMLIMSLTGLWLWWPRGSGLLRALRWTAFDTLHFQFAPPARLLDFDSAGSGLVDRHLSRVPANRARRDVIDNHNESASRAGAQHRPQRTSLTADRALEVALKAAPACTPVALFLPLQQRGEPRSELARANGRARRSTKRNGRRPQRSVNRHPPAAGRPCCRLDPMDP